MHAPSWRALFAQGDFPFYIVSLPAFTKRSPVPVDGDEWTETRESQALTAAAVPITCLAITIDTGDPDNIHAKVKQPVGERLALCALANTTTESMLFTPDQRSSPWTGCRMRSECTSHKRMAASY